MASLETLATARSQVFTELREDLERRGNSSANISRFLNCLTVSTEDSKANHGLTLIKAGYKLLQRPPTPQEHAHLSILSWLVEVFRASYVVSDEVMAHSASRNGQPCWSKYKGVGLTAVNDTCMLKTCIFLSLQRHFRNHPEYVAFVELFHEAAFRMELGRLCEKVTAATGGIEDMTTERYDHIARHRTAFGSFYLPVGLAIRHCGLASEEGMEQVETVLLDIGVYSHIRDDFLHCFGGPGVTGKMGTSIEGNKCTWGIMQALGLSESYGKRVKGMDALYADFEKRRRGELQAQIEAFEEDNGAIKYILSSALEGIGQ